MPKINYILLIYRNLFLSPTYTSKLLLLNSLIEFLGAKTDIHKRFISFVCGDRSTDTGMKLWKKIKNIPASVYYSDYWKSYKEFLPNVKHIQTKAETYTVEGYNSRIRHYLARFKRKGKCYSKAKHMIEKSLKLLFLKLNNEIAICV